MSVLWKVFCEENVFPGEWQRWYRNQCFAVGWAAKWGFNLQGATKGDKGWSITRNALGDMKEGDWVVVALRGNRVGRIGEITRKLVGDDHWSPLVPCSRELPDGENGRRVQVRWDLTVGPDNQDLVVQLPKGRTLNGGERQGTIRKVRSMTMDELQESMNDPSNWVRLRGRFRYEHALSDYIANFPNHLEDGLVPHPNSKIRERVFGDKSRLDVLLLDKANNAVIVECKQHAPTDEDFSQLRHYMKLFKKETKEMPRGILVHGGAQKVAQSG